MALQIQMNTIDETGTATPMYPMNRSSDVIVGLFAAATNASLPGESGNETLETSLALIKAYLGKLNNAAYMDVATKISDDDTTVPKTSLLYEVNEKVKTALQTTGGKMDGDITFPYGISGLLFTCTTGSASSLSSTTYEIKSIQYSVSGGGGTIYGGIGCSTLLPLEMTDDLGASGRHWNNLYATNIYGFTAKGSIVPYSGSTINLGSSDSSFMSLYCSNINDLYSIFFKPKPNDTKGTYVGFGTSLVQTGPHDYSTFITVNTSIEPIDADFQLGTVANPVHTIVASYIYGLESIRFQNTITSAVNTFRVITYNSKESFEISTPFFIPSANDNAYLGAIGRYFRGAYLNNIYLGTNGVIQLGDGAYIGGSGTAGGNYPASYIYTKVLKCCDGKTQTPWDIQYTPSLSVHYSSDPNDIEHPAGVNIGSTVLGIKIYSSYFDSYCIYAPTTNKLFTAYSDEKVKTITSDLRDDHNELLNVLEDLNIHSFIYKYDKSSDKTIGVVAQELEKAFIENGLDPFKYGILNVQYNALINMGSEEDKKFYTKFMTVSYDQLNTLYLIKIQSLNNELQRIKDEHTTEIDRLKSKNMELAGKIAAIEARLG